MPKKAKELLPIQIKRLKRPGLHAVGGVAGLHLQVKPSGARSWILRAVVGSKRRDIGLGGYPDVSLKGAHEAAQEAREQIRQGLDPVAQRRAARQSLMAEQGRQLSFEDAAVLCHKTKAPEFRSKKHSADWINSITTHVNSIIGGLPVGEIELKDIVRVLEPIWATKTETATRVRQRIESVLAWATVNQYRSGDNPARWKGNLEHALPKPSKIRKRQHFPALPWHEVGAFMADLRKRNGLAARALEFSILTAARSGETRMSTWDEIDFGAKVWTVPPGRMKAGKPHRVPLSKPAIDLLEAIPRIDGSPYVFTSARGGHLSDMALSSVTRRMKVNAVPHGFRSSFKDWCRSSTAYPDEVSELALAHVSSDATRAAYARDELLPKRANLMRDWAKFCDTIPSQGDVVPIGKTG